jgi:hypothetical protein
MDKATREVRVFEPENLAPQGGSTAVVSDGTKVYCAGRKSLLEPGFIPQSELDVGVMLHAVDKTSENLTSVPITSEERISGIGAVMYSDGRIYAGSNDVSWFGTINGATGEFAREVQSGLINVFHRDARTGFFYWANSFSVERFDPESGSLVSVIPDEIGDAAYPGVVGDDSYLYWVQQEYTIRSTGEDLRGGIVRVQKTQ